MKRTLPLASLVVVAFAAPCLGKPAFWSISFEAACKRAKAENKIVMVDFYTTWCGWCKVLDRTTWKDAKVKRLLGEKTIAIKVDAEKERELSKQYKIQGFPCIVFIRPDGEEITRLMGYRDARTFLGEAGPIFAKAGASPGGGDSSGDPGLAYSRIEKDLARREKELAQFDKLDDDKSRRKALKLRREIIEEFDDHYSALLRADRPKDARKLAGRLLKLDASRRTYEALIKAALESDRPKAAKNLMAQAEKKLSPKEAKALRKLVDRAKAA